MPTNWLNFTDAWLKKLTTRTMLTPSHPILMQLWFACLWKTPKWKWPLATFTVGYVKTLPIIGKQTKAGRYVVSKYKYRKISAHCSSYRRAFRGCHLEEICSYVIIYYCNTHSVNYCDGEKFTFSNHIFMPSCCLSRTVLQLEGGFPFLQIWLLFFTIIRRSSRQAPF